MYLRNNFLVLGNQIRSIVLIPLNPVSPHFYNFLSIEFSRDAKPRNCVNIGVEVFLFFKLLIVCPEYFDYFLLIGGNLS